MTSAAFSAQELDDLSTGAQAIAREAGALARDYFERARSLVVDDKGPQDYVTEADRAVEQLISERLRELCPDVAVVGEEFGGQRNEGAPAWLVDPIDGTSNFIRGIPLYCVSMGLVVDEVSRIGLIYDPSRDELFSAVEGQGAQLNGQPIHVSGQADRARSLVGIGRSHRTPQPPVVAMIGDVVEVGGAFRKLGSAALAGAWVAAGRLDAYVELHINAWDFAAVHRLGLEAGARSELVFHEGVIADGAPFLVSTPGLHEWLTELLGKHLAAC